MAMAACGESGGPGPAPPAAAADEKSGVHFVALQRVEPPGGEPPAQRGHDPSVMRQAGPVGQEWQTACRRLTARVELLSPTRALLDLGACTDAEAVVAVQGLLVYLARWDIPARAGIAPSGCLAELALLRATAHGAVRRISSSDAPAVLATTPVALLPQLCFADAVTPAVVARLHGYGLRTLGHVARVGELALRRQFGAHVGSILAALATGRDPRPLSPTPPPASLRVRLRVPGGAVAPERLPAVLAHVAGQVARHLCAMGRHAGTLQVAVCWETGARQQVAHTLRQPTSDPALLRDALLRLLLPLLAPGVAITDVHLTLLDLAPVAPEQAAFWRTHTQRLAAIGEMADTLTRRHGKPLLLAPQLIAPDAVFSEERHALIARGTETLPSTLSPAAPAVPAPSPRDAWQTVPHRLHWW